MLEVILLILKIIGIVLLAILGLVLLVVLALLFVPFRYKARGRKYEKIEANGSVTWLLHALRVKFSFEDGKLKSRIKFLFFTITDSEKEEKKSDKKQDKEAEAEDGFTDEFAEEEPISEEAKVEEPEVEEPKAEESKVEKPKSVDIKTEETKTEEVTEEAEPEGTKSQEDDNILKESKRYKGSKKKIKKKKEKVNNSKGKQGIVKKIKNIYNMKNDEQVRKFLSVTKKRIIKIVKHILPRKVTGHVHFGMNDPATTGQILGLVSMFYPLYANHLFIEPSFEEAVIEGDLYVKGRIRVFSVLMPALRLYFGKDFKLVKHKFKKAVK